MKFALPRREKLELTVILLAGLINGLLFVYLMPPWQHYDEPTHFEFAWLLANRPDLANGHGYDQGLRREIAASMVEHGFFQRMDMQPNLLALGTPVWIGIPEESSYRFYHYLAGLPMRLLSGASVETSLYAGRLVSLLLFLLALAAAYGLAAELVSAGHPLRWLLPLGLALLPANTDIMTAINDDVGAAAFGTLFLFAAVRLQRRGFSWPRLGLFLAAGGLCAITKSTALLVAAAGALLMAIGLLPGKARPWVTASLVLLAGLAAFGWSDPAEWARSVPLDRPARLQHINAPVGRDAMQLHPTQATPDPRLEQFYTPQQAKQLQSQTVTVGAWMWADQPANAFTPILWDGEQQISRQVAVTRQPAFYTMTATLSPNLKMLQVRLAPVQDPAQWNIHFYYDGVVIATGAQPFHGVPVFNDASATAGTWDGQPFTNLVRNASGERGWPYLRGWADAVLSALLPTSPAAVLAALLHPAQAGWYWRGAGVYLFQTFWGRFGWGEVPLVLPHGYLILAGLCLLALPGLLAVWLRLRQAQDQRVGSLLWMGALLAITWLAVWLRGADTLYGHPFLPAARYAAPLVAASLAALLVGWLEDLRRLSGRMRLTSRYNPYILAGALLALDALGVWSIVSFYYTG